MTKTLWLVAALALAACNQRRSEPFVGPIELDEAEQRGELLFYRNCNECHPQGESGLAPGLNDKLVPDFVLKNQVRNPIAFMPEFEEDSLTDQQLDDLVEYLKALRRAKQLKEP